MGHLARKASRLWMSGTMPPMFHSPLLQAQEAPHVLGRMTTTIAAHGLSGTPMFHSPLLQAREAPHGLGRMTATIAAHGLSGSPMSPLLQAQKALHGLGRNAGLFGKAFQRLYASKSDSHKQKLDGMKKTRQQLRRVIKEANSRLDLAKKVLKEFDDAHDEELDEVLRQERRRLLAKLERLKGELDGLQARES